VDKCFVPSDALYKCARDRNVQPEQIVQIGLPIQKGFWATPPSAKVKTNRAPNKNFFDELMSNLTGGGGSSTDTSTDTSSTSNANANDANKSRLRGELDLEDDLPTVLIVGGGDGMGGIIQQATALGDTLNQKADDNQEKYQMVVVCGKNEKAQTDLSKRDWGEGVNVVVNGFVTNMDEWMRASDVIVTKAGPGTIAEASICGLPCMLSSYL
jgi:1,2-diacylglycerol 3-beta-galactosyltransferase